MSRNPERSPPCYEDAEGGGEEEGGGGEGGSRSTPLESAFVPRPLDSPRSLVARF